MLQSLQLPVSGIVFERGACKSVAASENLTRKLLELLGMCRSACWAGFLNVVYLQRLDYEFVFPRGKLMPFLIKFFKRDQG